MKNLHILTTSIAAIAASTQSISAETLLVPEQYPDIQSAVNAVDEDGDVIDVGPGTYDGFDAQSVPHTFQILSRGGPEQTFFRLDNPTQLPLFKLPEGCTIRGFTCENIEFTTSNDFPFFITAPNSEVQEFVFTNCNNNGSNYQTERAHLGPGSYLDCNFSDCSSTGGSFAFSTFSNTVDIPQRVIVEDCTFTNCSTTQVFLYRTTTQNSLFEGCQSTTLLYAPNTRPENCMFKSNTDPNGGVSTSVVNINSVPGSRDVYNCRFENNSGRSIYIVSTLGASDIVGCEFSNNSSIGNGTAIFIGSSNYTHFVSDCIFTNNTNNLPGSAIYTEGSTVAFLVSTSACGNTPNNFYGQVNSSDPSNNISVDCEEEVSCCLPGSCLVLPTNTCADAGGISLTGDCNQEDCPNEGACCIDGDCVFTNLETCFDLGGNYAGFGTDCASTICESTCEGDISGNGDVGLTDLIAVLSNWGPCPG